MKTNHMRGQSIATVCREHGLAENTFYRWRKTYGGMSINEAQRLKEVEIPGKRVNRFFHS